MGFQSSLQGGEDLDGKGREGKKAGKTGETFQGSLTGLPGIYCSLCFECILRPLQIILLSPLLPKQHDQLSKLLSKDKSFTKPSLMSQPNVLLTFLLGNLSIFSKTLILAHSSTYPGILVVCIHASARHQLPLQTSHFFPHLFIPISA